MSNCKAKQFSDQMVCTCGNVWDVNDSHPPDCLIQPKLSTKQAVLHVLNTLGISKYRIAKETQIRPIMIDNYLKRGSRMSEPTATRFEDIFGIEITDVYKPKSKELTHDSKTPSN